MGEGRETAAAVRDVVVAAAEGGMRLDVLLARSLPEREAGWTRSAIQKMIAAGSITVNGGRTKPSLRVKPGDRVEIRRAPPAESPLAPEALPLDILYEDEDCIVLNKAPGMVVHPAAGRTAGTLVNALLHHCPNLSGIGGERRPGIVHRLDKDTSGVMVVAKSARAFQSLGAQFKERRVGKEYIALVWGRMKKQSGAIDRPIGRHRSDRKKMSSLRAARAREALTGWRVEEFFPLDRSGGKFSAATLLRLTLHSGRTHQIRVHLADEGHPLIGDPLYGPKSRSTDSPLSGFPRQALHANLLRFTHPGSGAAMKFRAPLAPDMERLLRDLRHGKTGG